MSEIDDEKVFNQMSPELKNSTPTSKIAPEIGWTGLNRWGYNVFEEFLTTLRWPRAGYIYKEMSSNDPVITAILLCARELIRKVTWKVVPASSSSVDKQAAEFLKQCLDDMSTPWSDVIDEITSYFDYGWSYHEIVYKRRLGDSNDPYKCSKYNDGRIGWRKLPGRSQESWGGWEFSAEDDGALAGMWQYAPDGKLLIPIEKGMLFRTTVARGNPEGRSFLRGAYRPWYFKKHIEEIEGIGIERDLAGLPVLTTPENVDIWDTTNLKAQQIRSTAVNLVKSVKRDKNEGIVLPFGWDLKLLNSSGSRQFDTNGVINRYDQRIAITMLSDIVMLGADKVGSFALASVKKSLLASSLDAQVKSVADVFNRHAIPRLFKLNVFPGLVEYPKLEPSPVDTPDIKDLAEYISKLAGSKMPLFPDIDLENYLRSIANLPAAPEDEASRQAMLEAAKTATPNKQNPNDPNKNTDPNTNKGKGDPNNA